MASNGSLILWASQWIPISVSVNPTLRYIFIVRCLWFPFFLCLLQIWFSVRSVHNCFLFRLLKLNGVIVLYIR